MTEITFFEKPGCTNGEKQKAILRAAGHSLRCIDILSYSWNREKLLAFVAGKAPVEMMVADPILIKRPFVEVDGLSIQGFMNPRFAPYLGDWDGNNDVVTCPNLQALSCDEQKRGN